MKRPAGENWGSRPCTPDTRRLLPSTRLTVMLPLWR